MLCCGQRVPGVYVNIHLCCVVLPSRLENMREEMWGSMVEVVSCDMRVWEAPQKADILISELLGSFGDNELSPECLDGAQRFLQGERHLDCVPG